MRFIPTTHMQSGDVCFEFTTDNNGIASGIVSGSFTSGSETWNYIEFRSDGRLNTRTYQFEPIKGFTKRARVFILGGGGGGGSAACTYAPGGGGGAGELKIINDVKFYSGNTYNVQIGGGGDGGDPCNSNPSLVTYNGDNGTPSRIYISGQFNITAASGEGGNGNHTPTLNTDGGDSGNGFSGGNDAGVNLGGGGAGASANGQNANSVISEAGDGGAGITLNFPYTSPTYGASSVGVAGGGGGGNSLTNSYGVGTDGAGTGAGFGVRGASSAERYKGAGGGGGNNGSSKPDGSDGFVAIWFPTGSCS